MGEDNIKSDDQENNSNNRSTSETTAEPGTVTVELELQDDANAPSENDAEPVDPEPHTDVPLIESQPEQIPLQKQASAIMPLLIGGAVCAALGFGAAVLTQQQSPLWSENPDRIAFEENTQVQIAQMVDQIKALSDRPIPEVSQADIGQLRNELETLGKLKETNTQLSDQLIDVVARVSALEKSTIESAIPDDLVAKYREEIESMNAYLDSQRSAIQSFMDDAKTKADAAEKVARDITLRGALDKISIAMDSGLAFEDVIADLSDALDGAAPQALVSSAASGVATVQDLSSSFASSARAALATARAELDQGQGISKIGNFLKSQFNARSVVPKTGDDADAVLSRAEAAVKQGDIATALAEINTLSNAARAQMSEWIASAEARVSATDAIKTLRNDLGQ